MARLVNPSPDFWRGKRVMVTGHSGFKGAWLMLWLEALGARPFGYSLAPDTEPSLACLLGVNERFESVTADIRNIQDLTNAVARFRPDIIFHLAAQALVRRSYHQPVETFATNLMGTVNILNAATEEPSVKAIVVVTTDKCYENREWLWPYREDEALGGVDPYSASKACAEIATSAWRRSLSSLTGVRERKAGLAIATARAGNVIGGGDWADDRLVPDCVRALSAGKSIVVRSPSSTRPWQHVLEPLCGYLILAQLLIEKRANVEAAWNFGPPIDDVKPVSWVVDRIVSLWGRDARWETTGEPQPHEASLLAVDASKARAHLGWKPRLKLAEALRWTVDWYTSHRDGATTTNLVRDQINAYEHLPLEI